MLSSSWGKIFLGIMLTDLQQGLENTNSWNINKHQVARHVVFKQVILLLREQSWVKELYKLWYFLSEKLWTHFELIILDLLVRLVMLLRSSNLPFYIRKNVTFQDSHEKISYK